MASEHAAAMLCLPSFWCDAPRSWFTMAEGQFCLRNITDSLVALPRNTFCMIVDIMEQEAQTDDAYSQLKAALVSSNTMSDYTRGSSCS
jgi:hypothetical protein